MRYFNNCNQYDFGEERTKYGDRYFKDVPYNFLLNAINVVNFFITKDI